jgi:hypothetical protein
MAPSTRGALAPFLILFSALYAGFGVLSPYLPALLDDRLDRQVAAAAALRPDALVIGGLASGPGFLTALEARSSSVRSSR